MWWEDLRVGCKQTKTYLESQWWRDSGDPGPGLRVGNSSEWSWGRRRAPLSCWRAGHESREIVTEDRKGREDVCLMCPLGITECVSGYRQLTQRDGNRLEVGKWERPQGGQLGLLQSFGESPGNEGRVRRQAPASSLLQGWGWDQRNYVRGWEGEWRLSTWVPAQCGSRMCISLSIYLVPQLYAVLHTAAHHVSCFSAGTGLFVSPLFHSRVSQSLYQYDRFIRSLNIIELVFPSSSCASLWWHFSLTFILKSNVININELLVLEVVFHSLAYLIINSSNVFEGFLAFFSILTIILCIMFILSLLFQF